MSVAVYLASHRRDRTAVTATEHFAFQQQRLLGAQRVLQLLNMGDTDQLRREAETDLFYSIDGIASVVDRLDSQRLGYLSGMLDNLQADVTANHLQSKSTEDLLTKVAAVRHRLP